jgi:hypothetical protein
VTICDWDNGFRLNGELTRSGAFDELWLLTGLFVPNLLPIPAVGAGAATHELNRLKKV